MTNRREEIEEGVVVVMINRARIPWGGRVGITYKREGPKSWTVIFPGVNEYSGGDKVSVDEEDLIFLRRLGGSSFAHRLSGTYWSVREHSPEDVAKILRDRVLGREREKTINELTDIIVKLNNQLEDFRLGLPKIEATS